MSSKAVKIHVFWLPHRRPLSKEHVPRISAQTLYCQKLESLKVTCCCPSVITWYNQSWQSEDTRSHLLQKSVCIRTYCRKYTQVLFTKPVCTAYVASTRDVWFSNTDNFRSVVIAERRTDLWSQCLERLYQSLREPTHWCFPSPVQTLRILRYTSAVLWWTLRYSWWTTIW